MVFKVNEGRPNVADQVVNGKVQLVLNTPLGRASFFDDRTVRRAAMLHGVPCITTLTGGAAAVSAIRAHARATSSTSARCRTTTQELPPRRRLRYADFFHLQSSQRAGTVEKRPCGRRPPSVAPALRRGWRALSGRASCARIPGRLRVRLFLHAEPRGAAAALWLACLAAVVTWCGRSGAAFVLAALFGFWTAGAGLGSLASWEAGHSRLRAALVQVRGPDAVGDGALDPVTVVGQLTEDAAPAETGVRLALEVRDDRGGRHAWAAPGGVLVTVAGAVDPAVVDTLATRAR